MPLFLFDCIEGPSIPSLNLDLSSSKKQKLQLHTIPVQARRPPPPLGQQGRPLQQPAADVLLRYSAALPPGERPKRREAGPDVGRARRSPGREQARRLAARRARVPRARSEGKTEGLLAGARRRGRGEPVAGREEPFLVRAVPGRLADLGLRGAAAAASGARRGR